MSDNEEYQQGIFSPIAHDYKGEHTASHVCRIVKRFLSSPILDIGAGSGALMRHLKSLGHTVRGVDLCPMSENIEKGSITDLPLDDVAFQTAFLCDVIEHLTDEQISQGLKETYRVLASGGHFTITTPFDEDLERNIVACPECSHRFHRYGHHQTFDRQRIRTLLEENGFKVVFLKVYALGAMGKLPLGRYLHSFIKRFDFEFIGKSLVVVARRP